MILSMTCTDMELRDRAPVVFRGDVESSLRQIKAAGFDGVEMHIHDSACYDYQKLSRLLQENELKLTSIGTGTAYGKDGLSFTSDDAGKRRGAIERINGHTRAAAQFEDAVVILGLVRGKVSECSAGLQEYEKRLKESLRECVKTAEDMGVCLVLEMINRYECDYASTIDEGLALLSDIPSESLKLHLDTYHMNIEESDIAAAVHRAGKNIGHVHLADNDRRYPGHGHYDFKETIDALKAVGYQGALAVECLKYPDAKTVAQETVKAIKPYL